MAAIPPLVRLDKRHERLIAPQGGEVLVAGRGDNCAVGTHHLQDGCSQVELTRSHLLNECCLLLLECFKRRQTCCWIDVRCRLNFKFDDYRTCADLLYFNVRRTCFQPLCNFLRECSLFIGRKIIDVSFHANY